MSKQHHRYLKYQCGAVTARGGTCTQAVGSPDEHCWQHKDSKPASTRDDLLASLRSLQEQQRSRARG